MTEKARIAAFSLALILSLGIIPLPDAAARADEAGDWARVADCRALDRFRERYPDRGYVANSTIARQCRRAAPQQPRQERAETPRQQEGTARQRTERNTGNGRSSNRAAQQQNNQRATRPSTTARQPAALTGAELAQQGSDAQNRGDLPAARQLYRQACEAGGSSAFGCNQYAVMLENSAAGTVDLPGARTYFAAACNISGDPLYCDNAWVTAVHPSYGAPYTSETVIRLHQASGKGEFVDCTGWRARSCSGLAKMYELTAVPANTLLARRLFQRACDADTAFCYQSAVALSLTSLGPVDVAATRGSFLRIPPSVDIDCATYAFNCFIFAQGQANADPATGFAQPNIVLAERFARAACAGREARACNLLGRLRYDARISSITPEQAFQHFYAACNSGSLADACNNLGLAYEIGFGTGSVYGLRNNVRYPANAFSYFERGCTVTTWSDWPSGPALGRANACYNLGRAYRDGIHVQRNIYAARVHFDTACTYGSRPACLAAGRR